MIDTTTGGTTPGATPGTNPPGSVSNPATSTDDQTFLSGLKGPFFDPAKRLTREEADRLSQIAGTMYGVPPAVLLTQMYSESGFKVNEELTEDNGSRSIGLTQIGDAQFSRCLNEESFIKNLSTDIKSPAANELCYAYLLSRDNCGNLADNLSYVNRRGVCNYVPDCRTKTDKSTYVYYLVQSAQSLSVKAVFLQGIGKAESEVVQICTR